MQSVPMSEPILRDDEVISKVDLVARQIETIAPWSGELLVGRRISENSATERLGGREKWITASHFFPQWTFTRMWRWLRAGKLMGQERAREADLEPAARDRVKHADFARQLERMVEDGEHGSGNEAGFLAAHRGRSQEYDRVWAVAAIRVEIVFDCTDVRVAEFVAYRDQIERLLPIILSGLFGRPYVGKELNTEVHLLANPLVVPQNLIRSKFTEQQRLASFRSRVSKPSVKQP
jgi:hypothetical protein